MTTRKPHWHTQARWCSVYSSRESTVALQLSTVSVEGTACAGQLARQADRRVHYFLRNCQPPHAAVPGAAAVPSLRASTARVPAGHLYLGALLGNETGGAKFECPAPRPMGTSEWAAASTAQSVQLYLQQCMAHAQEEYLVRLTHPLFGLAEHLSRSATCL